jgi:hypothetical protein
MPVRENAIMYRFGAIPIFVRFAAGPESTQEKT